VILNTTVAKELKEFADRIETAEDRTYMIAHLIRKTFRNHGHIIFNGDGYSKEWEAEAAKRGLLNLRTSVDAFDVFDAPKNIALFTEFSVFSGTEIEARKEILYETYLKTIRIEAMTMIDMAQKQILPGVETYVFSLAKTLRAKVEFMPELPCRMERDLIARLSRLQDEAYAALNELIVLVGEANRAPNVFSSAMLFANSVCPAMAVLREKVDAMESLTAKEHWPLPTYGEMTHRQ
jgi:glutamine synthetase